LNRIDQSLPVLDFERIGLNHSLRDGQVTLQHKLASGVLADWQSIFNCLARKKSAKFKTSANKGSGKV
jgi:hypothetical protein